MGMNVSAILLAAGIGTRLRPLTEIIPKCLAPIKNKPLLGLWLEMLERSGVDDTIINTHHHARLVEHFICKSPYANKAKLVYEPKLLGTAGTLFANYRNTHHNTIMLAHADNLSSFDVTAFLQAHTSRPQQAVMTMMTFDTDAPSQCGIVDLDANGMVTAFYEKAANPPGIRANAAIYLIDRTFIETLARDKTVTDFSTEVLPRFMGKIYTFHNDCYHLDIGTPARLQRAQLEWPSIMPATDSENQQNDPWYGLLADNPELANSLANQMNHIFDI